MSKPTLEEMAELAQLDADRLYGFLKFYEQQFPAMPPDQRRYHEFETREAEAQLLRILGTYPDESRAFVAGLLKRAK